MRKIVESFEKTIIIVLVVMMMIAIFFGTIELAVMLGAELFKAPLFLLDIRKLLDIFGFFFMILIGLELLETIKTYMKREQIHVEIVFLVAMIAIARKVIILDVKTLSPVTLLGIASIIAGLALGYYLVRASHQSGGRPLREQAGQ